MNKLTYLQRLELIARIKHYQEAATWSSDGLISLPEDDIKQCISIALPVLEQQGGWISCSDRLPKDDGQYWGWWSEEKRQGPVWFIERQSQFQSYQITHWMPLPSPPQPQPSTPHIDNDGWIEWKGGVCAPVTGIVEVKWSSGSTDIGAAGVWRWEHCQFLINIIAYRVIENDGREG
ncbi:DUF551 domain-containing protein [Candidatus Pantoea formicae]|uniref:DUF551 domain-containing protein n=1 Tax=Candidatus Pantoea formicae TaxID=2608355 RepID=UPI003EDA7912